MIASEIRRWVASHQAAEARERAEMRAAGPAPAEAIAGALALIALAGRLHGWPLPEDAVSRREDALAYGCWTRLRARLAPR